jgi:hypothetical protein
MQIIAKELGSIHKKKNRYNEKDGYDVCILK